MTRMTSDTRNVVGNQLLLGAPSGPIAFNAVDRRVKHENPSAAALAMQSEMLDAIREWMSDGLKGHRRTPPDAS